MAENSAVVSVGDKIEVHWPNDDGTTEKVSATVSAIEKCKKEKSGSLFKYSLVIKTTGEEHSTRLLHLKWKKVARKQKHIEDAENQNQSDCEETQPHRKKAKKDTAGSLGSCGTVRSDLPAHSRIVAPMVGGSELAFRLLCRRYGADLAYTPMMNSERFAVDEDYRKEEFQTVPEDRPLVAHFSANNPKTFLKAAKHVENYCDAIDLNLGCPQRVAHAGHFGSYLLDKVDHPLIFDIVKTVSEGIRIPLFVKIRLLNTVEETIELCRSLHEAGAALIAVHARYRVNLVGRSGPGARDGAAHLDQIKKIKETLPHITIIANGNIITYQDCLDNIMFTGADGIMSAEGLLDDPALFARKSNSSVHSVVGNAGDGCDIENKNKNEVKKNKDEKMKNNDKKSSGKKSQDDKKTAECRSDDVEIPDKLHLALQYLDLADKYPVKMKSVIFHIRRICRQEFTDYQLMEDCVSSKCIGEVRKVVLEAVQYKEKKNFVFDKDKEKKAKEIIEKRKREEGKRKEFEARMIRKAKRENKEDLRFYLSKGAENPSTEKLLELKKLPKEVGFEIWKNNYSQHCYNYHFEAIGCHRDRTCSFLHHDPSFVEENAIAYG